MLLPFYQPTIETWISKKGKSCQELTLFLPSQKLIPLVVMMGLVKGEAYYLNPLLFLATLASFVLLAQWGLQSWQERNRGALSLSGIILFLTLASFVFFALFDYQGSGVRNWIATEYRELVIALGVMVYAGGVWRGKI